MGITMTMTQRRPEEMCVSLFYSRGGTSSTGSCDQCLRAPWHRKFRGNSFWRLQGFFEPKTENSTKEQNKYNVCIDRGGTVCVCINNNDNTMIIIIMVIIITIIIINNIYIYT